MTVYIDPTVLSLETHVDMLADMSVSMILDRTSNLQLYIVVFLNIIQIHQFYKLLKVDPGQLPWNCHYIDGFVLYKKLQILKYTFSLEHSDFFLRNYNTFPLSSKKI